MTPPGLQCQPVFQCRPASFPCAQGMELLQDLTSLEPGIILNAAFCARHRRRCAPSHQLDKECGKARGIFTLLPPIPLRCHVHPREQWPPWFPMEVL